MTASQKESVRGIFMALLTAQADLARIPGHTFTMSANNEGQKDWIRYPAARIELDETIRVLTRFLANAHGIPASYPLG
jgi:hypothetical protein